MLFDAQRKSVLFLSLLASASAFQAGGFLPSSTTGRSVQLRSAQRSVNAPRVAARKSLALNMGFDIEGLNGKMKDLRLAHLEEQAMEALRVSVSGSCARVPGGAGRFRGACSAQNGQ